MFSLFLQKQTIDEKDKSIAKLEAEKYYLGERIFELTGVEEGFWSDEILVIKKKTFISGFGGDDPDRGKIHQSSSSETNWYLFSIE